MIYNIVIINRTRSHKNNYLNTFTIKQIHKKTYPQRNQNQFNNPKYQSPMRNNPQQNKYYAPSVNIRNLQEKVNAMSIQTSQFAKKFLSKTEQLFNQQPCNDDYVELNVEPEL